VNAANLSAAINLAYLVAAILFILAFKLLAHPRTAVRGNVLGAAGMAIAIGATLLDRHINTTAQWFGLKIGGYGVVTVGIAVGAVIGAVMAVRVRMTSMPQMVALLNGFGGAASLLVAGAELHQTAATDLMPTMQPFGQEVIATALSGMIGAVTFWGSLMAFLKLEEKLLTGKQILFRGQQALNAALGLTVLGLAAWLATDPQMFVAYWLLVIVASVLGVLLTIPIGGADMPVVICLLNSYSGLAAAATGFVIDNNVLIISGSLVGASGIILSKIMCKAMNRSLVNVLFGVMGPTSGAATADSVYAGRVKSASAEEIAMLFDSARRVVIVPGYGLAVAQAQHAVRELAEMLESRGIEVEYGIHPVAGRMPGHMNVLLAEANVPYDKMKEMDEINPTFPETDVALVIGANDVVNPLARTDPKSPIAGMPILNVDLARTVVVVKRSLSPGFAGIPNPLFAADNTLMYYGDGKKAVLDLIAAVKESA
jgi:proton-translocating NAD(P)+ transhydrogenase subunit beta